MKTKPGRKMQLEPRVDSSQGFEKGADSSPYSLDKVELKGNIISLKVPILIHKDRLALVEKLAEVMDKIGGIETYVREAFLEKIETDLTSPNVVGQAFCERQLSLWNRNTKDLDENLKHNYHMMQQPINQ